MTYGGPGQATWWARAPATHSHLTSHLPFHHCRPHHDGYFLIKPLWPTVDSKCFLGSRPGRPRNRPELLEPHLSASPIRLRHPDRSLWMIGPEAKVIIGTPPLAFQQGLPVFGTSVVRSSRPGTLLRWLLKENSGVQNRSSSLGQVRSSRGCS